MDIALNMCSAASSEARLPTPMCWDLALYVDRLAAAVDTNKCLPNGVLFDAFGNERKRFVRVMHDGATCVVRPEDVADLVDAEKPGEYTTQDVHLSDKEHDALPEFDGF